MSKFTEKSPIPAVPGSARIDIRYGGTVDQVERESVAIADAYLSTLNESKTLLYINTLSPDLEMGSMLHELRKSIRSECLRERFRFETFEGDGIYDKRGLLINLVEEFHLRVLILNSFDFASLSPKGRRRVFNTLKYLRDHLRLHIIIYTRHEPKKEAIGTMSDLAYIAASISAMESPVLVAMPRRKSVVRAQTVATEHGLATVDVTQDVHYMHVETADQFERPLAESGEDLNDWRKNAIQKYTINSVDRSLDALMKGEELPAAQTLPSAPKPAQLSASSGSGASSPAHSLPAKPLLALPSPGDSSSSPSSPATISPAPHLPMPRALLDVDHPDYDPFDTPLDPNDPEEAAYIEELKWKNYGG